MSKVDDAMIARAIAAEESLFFAHLLTKEKRMRHILEMADMEQRKSEVMGEWVDAYVAHRTTTAHEKKCREAAIAALQERKEFYGCTFSIWAIDEIVRATLRTKP